MYQAAWCNIPEDLNLCQHYCENLRSQIVTCTQVTCLFLKLIFFSCFLKAGSGMPSSQQPYPGVYPPPDHATVQLSYPLNPGFAGHINTPGMSQYPAYPTANTSSYPASHNAPYPGYPPTSQPPYAHPVYASSLQSSCPYPTSEFGLTAPAPTSFAPQPQPYSPVVPACATVGAAGPPSMNLGGQSLNRAGSNVARTVQSAHTKVRSMN